jgi:hypothetical protein
LIGPRAWVAERIYPGLEIIGKYTPGCGRPARCRCGRRAASI